MVRGDREKGRATTPRIRRAQIVQINIYEISENELNELARGSPASIDLNFALLPVSGTILITLQTATFSSNLILVGYHTAFWLTLIQGLRCLALWWRNHDLTRRLVEEIKDRMPPPGIQDVPETPRVES